MSVFSASPQCFSLAHDGEIFQVPLFHFFPFWLLFSMGFSFMPFIPALVFEGFVFLSSFWIFFWGKRSTSLRFFFYSLLALSLAAILTMLRSLLSHYPFSLWFPLFHSVVILTGYLLFCCPLVGFSPLDFGQSFYLYVHVPAKSRCFSLFFQHRLALQAGGTCVLCSHHKLDVPFESPLPKVGTACRGPAAFDSAALQLFIS